MIKTTLKGLFCAAMILLTASSQPALARKKKTDVQQESAPAPAPSAFQTAVNGSEARHGLLNLFLKDGRVLVEVPLSVMDKDLLVASTVSSVTDNAFFSPGEMPRKPLLAFFSMENGKLALCRHRFDLESEDENIGRSIEINTLRSILMAFDVKAWSDDKSSVLADMTEFFAGNNADLSPFPKTYPGGMQVREQFKRDLSYVADGCAFSDNVSVRSVMSYSVTATNASKKPTRFADTPFTVEVTRSIMLLPQDAMPVRLADPRVGTFSFSKTSFANSNAWAKNVSYTQKWRLEEGRPIVFYIDPSFPESWKPYIRKGVEVWNEAFSRIGFEHAVQARDYPSDDPEFNPDNLKYSCIRYSPSTSQNAMGPSWYDPRTGEILSANVTVNHNVIKLIQLWRFVLTGAADERARGKVLPEELFGESLSYVVSHEVGHCLGLMHNMGASSGIPVESLRDAAFTAEHGTTYSIMDYARYNYVAQPGDVQRGVLLCPPSLGVYDLYAIEWLYTPNDEEYRRNLVESHSGDLRFRYGRQQLQGVVDPSSIDEDLGDDPRAASEYGIRNLRFIAEHMDEWCGSWDEDYSFRKAAFQMMLGQYQRYISACIYNVGGRYLTDHIGADKWVACTDVPVQRQRESVEFILNSTADLAWLDSESLKMCRAGHTEIAGDMAASMFRALIKKCDDLRPEGDDVYTKDAFLGDVCRLVLAPSKRSRSLSASERTLQVQLVSYLITGSDISEKRAITSNNSAVHTCYSHLLECRNVFAAKAKTGDEATRNHYAFLLHKIDKSLSR